MTQDALPPFNDELREGVLGLVGSISPEGVPIGGVLSYIIGLFWPTTDSSEHTWKSIQKYAEAMVDKKVDVARIGVLTDRLEGLKGVAQTYRETSMGSAQKGQHLTNLLDDLTLYEQDFWHDKQSPEKIFPLFSTFGTLWIFAKAEQALYYKDVYREEDADKAKHMQTLRDDILRYTANAQAMFDNLYAWRFSLLELSMHWVGTWGGDKDWQFTDNYDGYTVGGDVSSITQQEAETYAADRAAQITGDFVESLQDLLAVAQMWAYADPAVPLPPTTYVMTGQGAVGGIAGDAFVDEPPSTSRISHINVRHGQGGVVDCLELFHDGKSAGAHGNPGGGDLSELSLAEDETVVEIWGRCGLFVDQLHFNTNKGRTVGGGGDGGQPFSAKGHAKWKDVSLFALSGRSDDRRLTGLNPVWRHQQQVPPYIASYKRTGKAVASSTDVRLKSHDGRYFSDLHEDYSGRAAANEYFPKIGANPVALQLQVPGVAAGELYDHTTVNVWTAEPIAKDYPYLGKFKADAVYYYSLSPGDGRQLWVLMKMIPSEGPILVGEKVYLRNVDNYWYLMPDAGDYLATRSEPYGWEIVPAT